ncbi:MAG: glycine/betaine ABC transporter substrate-binding protein [Deltaproteobacteria bacterium]|nr:glycine/betaine ABC transporter substrate-binding protein [Deltaproteobacteria bacterium]MBN2688185.1 glycine/betaine ABC transporter substrate-binding protein [Deltaproteobacteria bacterium]
MKSLMKVVIALAVSACLLAPGQFSMAKEKKITVGGKNFTEQYLLPELAKALLEENGFQVDLKTGLPTNMARKAVLTGEIDFYYEYTGTAYTVFYKQENPEVMNDPQAVYRWVGENEKKKDLIWLDPVRLNNTYTLMMRRQQAQKRGISSISDLAAYVEKHPKDVTIGIGTEFWNRPDGFKKLAQIYGLNIPFENIKKMSLGLAYQALKDGQIDVGMGFATDGRIAAFGFVNLEDNKQFFPVYNPAPVVRKEVLEKYPEIQNILKPLAEKLDTSAMQSMNKAVDVEHKSEADVARAWLKEEGLL